MDAGNGPIPASDVHGHYVAIVALSLAQLATVTTDRLRIDGHRRPSTLPSVLVTLCDADSNSVRLAGGTEFVQHAGATTRATHWPVLRGVPSAALCVFRTRLSPLRLSRRCSLLELDPP